jgi:hypothetical protein
MHGKDAHAFYIHHLLSLEITRYSKTLDKWGVLLGGDTLVHHPIPSPNGPLQVETTSQYFADIFNTIQ